MIKFLFIQFIVIFQIQSAQAFPIEEGLQEGQKLFAYDPIQALTDPYFTANYNFEGIVSTWSCSASLVRYENSRDTDKAMVLTNGHCLGRMPSPNTYVVNQSSSTSFSVLDPQGRSMGRIRSTHVIYGTMTGTDMAIFRLENTYSEILSQYNVRPLTLSSRKAQLSDSIEIVSGYWKRGYSCGVEKFVHTLKEAGWTMKDSIRYSRPGCNTIGGTSGSPIILAGTRTVIGVNNTGNESGGRCTMNNPCEVDENGNVEAHEGFSYGQQINWIYTCLNDQLELDLNKQGCLLYH